MVNSYRVPNSYKYLKENQAVDKALFKYLIILPLFTYQK